MNDLLTIEQMADLERSAFLLADAIQSTFDLGGGLVRVSVDSLLHGEIDKYIAPPDPKIGKD